MSLVSIPLLFSNTGPKSRNRGTEGIVLEPIPNVSLLDNTTTSAIILIIIE